MTTSTAVSPGEENQMSDSPQAIAPRPASAAATQQVAAPAKPDVRISSLLAEEVQSWGRIAAPAGIRIKGRHVGHIFVPTNDNGPAGDILVDVNAEVFGVVEGFRVTVLGKVHGVVVAKEFLDVGSNGVITDGVLYNRWHCREGSDIGGKVGKINPSVDINAFVEPIVQKALEVGLDRA